MRVILTGGSGLIGRSVAAELAACGHEPIVLSREPAKVHDLPAGVRAERWDGKTAAGWGALLDRESAVVHLAGEPIAEGRWTDERKRRILSSRVESSAAVVAAISAAAVRPRVLLQASGIGYYGDTGDREVGEGDPPGDDFLARTCVAWEGATVAVEALGVRRAVLRTGVVLAREGGALPKMLLPFRLGVGGPLGDGRQWFPFLHLADEVGAIRFLLERDDAHGPFNLCAPNPVRNADFARALGRALYRPSFLPTPAFALRLALGELAQALLTGQRAFPRHLQSLGYSFHFPVLEGALADLLA
jgi:uncharacterized protein (TIGR01777 family)